MQKLLKLRILNPRLSFFFSSRGRHTALTCDWSSDVCSSDLSSSTGGASPCSPQTLPDAVPKGWVEYTDWSCQCRFYMPGSVDVMPKPPQWEPCAGSPARSEERRVGKGCRSWR